MVSSAMFLVCILACARNWAAAPELPSVSVGFPARVEQLVLPGSELEVIPIDGDATPIVLRIENVYRHGTDFRYDLVYYGLVPGDFNLRDYLRRIDGTSTDRLPNLPVRIESVLATGQVQPHPPVMRASPRLGGYRWALGAGAAAWLLGLVALLMWGRRSSGETTYAITHRQSLADRLRPYVQDAIQGRLSLEQRAELEMMLLTYWRRRLGLQDLKPAEAMQRMKAQPEAGELLRALEDWLHRPVSPESVNVAELLKPYQEVTDPVAAPSATSTNL